MVVSDTEARGCAPAAGARAARWRDGVALLVLVLAFTWTYRAVFEMPPSAGALHVTLGEGRVEGAGGAGSLVDHRFVVWLFSRNARTWLQDPGRLHDGEICHPTPDVVTLGEPGFTLGLLAVPGWLATGDPLVAFDTAVLLAAWIAVVAMYALVRAWTGLPEAGLIAALLYGLHPLKISDPIHYYVTDTGWTVLALLFFGRWLERGRWRDVLGLSVAASLQIGGSLYPLLGAAALGTPFTAWAVARLGVRRTRPAQWIVLVVGLALVLAFALGPYIERAGAGDLADRVVQFYLPWSQIFMDPERPLGWVLMALAAAAFLPWRSREGEGASPLGLRLALLAGVMLSLLLATGGNEAARMLAAAEGAQPPPALPNPFAWLAAVLPGLKVVRLPGAIGHASYLGLAVLAGLGSATILRRVPARWRPAAVVAAVVLVGVETLRLGLPGPPTLAMRPMRPAESELAFFATLAERGNTGPILEIPNEPRPSPRYGRSILLAAYHGRRTSGCYNSYLPATIRDVEAVSRRLPDRAALRTLAGHGFTTIVLHHEVAGRRYDGLRAALDQAAAGPDAPLAPVHHGAGLSAYRIVVEPTGAHGPQAE